MAKPPRKNPDDSFGDFSSEPDAQREQGDNLEDFFRTSAAGQTESPASEDGFVASVSAAARKFMEMARLKKAPAETGPEVSKTRAASSPAASGGIDSGTMHPDDPSPQSTSADSGVEEPLAGWAESRPAKPAAAETKPPSQKPERPESSRRSERRDSEKQKNQESGSRSVTSKASDLSAWDSLASELGITAARPAGGAESPLPSESAPDRPERVSSKQPDRAAGQPAGRREKAPERGQSPRRSEQRDLPEPRKPAAAFDSFGAGLLGETAPVPDFPENVRQHPPEDSDLDEDFPVEEEAVDLIEPIELPADLDESGDDFVEFEVEDLDPSSRRGPPKPRDIDKAERSPRRRRRGRRDREPVSADSEISEDIPAASTELEPVSEEAISDSGEGDGEPRTGRSRRRRSRGRGRRRREGGEMEPLSKTGHDPEDMDEDESVDREKSEEKPVRGGRDRRPEKQVQNRNRTSDAAKGARPVDDDDDFLEEGTTDQTSKPRNLPTWGETVDVLVKANMASRKHPPQRRRGGGGGRPGNPSGNR